MKKKMLNAFIVIDALLLIAALPGLIMLIYAGISGDTLGIFDYALLVAEGIVTLLALYYMLTGCTKGEGTQYYKWFMISFGLLMLITLYNHMKMVTAEVILMATAFGALVLLCFGKDLGRFLSTVLSLIVTGCSVAQLIFTMIGNDMTDMIWLVIGIRIVLALTTVLMVCAKYADKAERGSK